MWYIIEMKTNDITPDDKEEYVTLDELFNDLEKYDNRKTLFGWIDRKFPKGFGGYRLSYNIKRPWVAVEHVGYEIKWAWQRVFRGWDDRITWDMSSYFADLIVDVLKRFKEKNNGVPFSMYDESEHDNNGMFTDEQDNMASERWNEVIDEIIEGFQFYIDNDYSQYEDVEGKFKRAFDLFRKHFEDLWY